MIDQSWHCTEEIIKQIPDNAILLGTEADPQLLMREQVAKQSVIPAKAGIHTLLRERTVLTTGGTGFPLSRE